MALVVRLAADLYAEPVHPDGDAIHAQHSCGKSIVHLGMVPNLPTRWNRGVDDREITQQECTQAECP